MLHESHYTNLDTARSLHLQGRAWRIKITCNDSINNHHKFWTAQFDPATNDVRVFYGRIGTNGQGPLVKDWNYVSKAIWEKTSPNKGYVYATGTIPDLRLWDHAVSGNQGAQPKPAPVVPSKYMPAPDIVQPATRSGPYARICLLRGVLDDQGKTVAKWLAVDNDGKPVMTLSVQGGRDLAKAHPTEIRFEIPRAS